MCLSNEKIRSLAIELLTAVEELLDFHGIKIPDENRLGDPDEACLFGASYYALEDRFEELIRSELVSVKDVMP